MSAVQFVRLAWEASKALAIIRSRHLKGDAEATIIRLAQKLGANAIVVGTKASEGLCSLCVSDAAPRTVRRTNLSLLAMKPERFAVPVSAPAKAHSA